ncbi:hypothetical protein UPYG_G00272660 [Umbra pygmaea]|uniref:EF-hand domain-containing protein n=1 Tax=Umbra pygmaea TaxID=75934 RepID=A0ABD0X1K9_UMBPY
MSSWLNEEEVLVGEGSGTESPCSPRLMVFPTGCDTPRLGRRARLGSASSRASLVGHPEPLGTMGKAKELFVLCDKEGKGFITKRDMQRLQGELTLSPEQLESVFESLDTENNGFLTPVEFNMGLKGDMMWVEKEAEERQEQIKPEEVDPGEIRFTQILTDLGVVKVFTDHWELCRLWCDLHKERPELLSLLEEVLLQAVYQLQDSLSERHSLEQALHRRERDHDMVVQSIQEEMETRVREERERQLSQDSFRHWDRTQQIAEELKIKEQELEICVSKQKELEERIQSLGCEQADTRLQNQQLHSHNIQLQEQLESSREKLQTALDQLELLRATISEQERTRERRERDHERLVQSIYEEMDTQIREERERHLAKDSFRHWDRTQQIAEELKIKEQELEISVSKQKELEERIQSLGCEQADIRLQNQQLHSHKNPATGEQLESSRGGEPQTALDQLELLRATISEQERTRER